MDQVESEDFIPRKVSVGEERTAVVFIEKTTLDAEFNVTCFGKVEIREGQIPAGLPLPHDFPNAESHGINHADADHGLGKEAIAVATGRTGAAHVVVRRAVIEVTGILKLQFADSLNDEDALTARVVLVSDAIVERFKDDALVVF